MTRTRQVTESGEMERSPEARKETERRDEPWPLLQAGFNSPIQYFDREPRGRSSASRDAQMMQL